MMRLLRSLGGSVWRVVSLSECMCQGDDTPIRGSATLLALGEVQG